MELRFKKRIVGFLLLIGLGLIFIPLFFGRSAPTDELQLSGRIPTPPEKPAGIGLAIPPASATVPAPARASLPATANDNTNASRVVFEQVQSVPSATVGNSQQAAIAGTTGVNHNNSAATQGVSSSQASANNAPAAQLPPLVSTAKPITTANKSPTPSLSTTAIKPAMPAMVNSSKPSAVPAKNQHKAKSNKTSAAPTAWIVQMGSFSDKINAENLVKKLQAKGFAAYIQTNKTAQGSLIRVLVGPQLRRSDASKVQIKIQQELNLQGMVIKADI